MMRATQHPCAPSTVLFTGKIPRNDSDRQRPLLRGVAEGRGVFRRGHALRRERPVLVIEIEKRHTGKPVGETHRLIESLGYEGFFFEDGRQRPLSEYEERMQDPGYPSYVNDFLFLPAGRAR